MFKVFDRVQKFFGPDDEWPLKTELQFKRQREIQALWIGIFAFLMPAFLYYSNQTASCFRDTISHTYYTPFWGDVFVSLTSIIGILLLFYKGQSKPERWLAVIAGIAAIVVALIPTTGSGCENTYAPSRIFLFTETGTMPSNAFYPGESFANIHGIAAGVLFLMLTIFSLFVFTATDNTNPYQRSGANQNKHIRNTIYKITGAIMLTTLIALAVNKFFGFPDCDIFNRELGVGMRELTCSDEKLFVSKYWDKNNLTFYFEWLALASFGVAWFIKGRGGGFLLLDETPNQIISKPWWWDKYFVSLNKS